MPNGRAGRRRASRVLGRLLLAGALLGFGLAGGAVAAAEAADLEPRQVESESEPELETDRPDFTETSVVVPRGSLQVETGSTYAQGKGTRLLVGPEALLRWGVARRTEVRIGVPNYVYVRGAERAAGFNDSFLGFKQQLGPTASGFDVALIGHVTLPTGSSSLTSDAPDPDIALAWSRDLSEQWSTGGIFRFSWPTEGGSRNSTALTTVVVGRSLGERWGTFLEYVGEFPERGGKTHLAHHGYTYAVTATSQADIHVGVGLSRAAPDFFVGAGWSFRR